MQRRRDIWNRLDEIRATLESYCDTAVYSRGMLPAGAEKHTTELNVEREALWNELMTTQGYKLSTLQTMIEESRYRLSGGGIREKMCMLDMPGATKMVVMVANKQVQAAEPFIDPDQDP